MLLTFLLFLSILFFSVILSIISAYFSINKNNKYFPILFFCFSPLLNSVIISEFVINPYLNFVLSFSLSNFFYIYVFLINDLEYKSYKKLKLLKFSKEKHLLLKLKLFFKPILYGSIFIMIEVFSDFSVSNYLGLNTVGNEIYSEYLFSSIDIIKVFKLLIIFIFIVNFIKIESKNNTYTNQTSGNSAFINIFCFVYIIFLLFYIRHIAFDFNSFLQALFSLINNILISILVFLSSLLLMLFFIKLKINENFVLLFYMFPSFLISIYALYLPLPLFVILVITLIIKTIPITFLNIKFFIKNNKNLSLINWKSKRFLFLKIIKKPLFLIFILIQIELLRDNSPFIILKNDFLSTINSKFYFSLKAENINYISTMILILLLINIFYSISFNTINKKGKT